MKTKYQLYKYTCLKMAPMTWAIRIQVNKIQLNSLIVISLDAFVYISWALFIHLLDSEKKNQEKMREKWGEKRKMNATNNEIEIQQRNGITNVAANFIIFCKNKCFELWQFNEIICFSLAFSGRENFLCYRAFCTIGKRQAYCIMKIAFFLLPQKKKKNKVG